MRGRSVGRRVGAVFLALPAAVFFSGPSVWHEVTGHYGWPLSNSFTVGRLIAVFVLVVLAWGVARRRSALWLVGLVLTFIFVALWLWATIDGVGSAREVDRLCDYVTIIKDGRQVESAPLSALRHLSATTIRVGSPPPGLVDDIATLGLSPSESVSDAADAEVGWAVPRGEVPHVLGVLSARGVTDVTCTPASLEELFLRHYGTGVT